MDDATGNDAEVLVHLEVGATPRTSEGPMERAGLLVV